MSAQEAVEGSAEEVAPEPGVDLVVAAPQQVGAFIAGDRPEDIIAKAGTIATALDKLIKKQGMSTNMGGNREHVEVGAWQACGMMLGALGGQPLHAETVWTRVVRDASLEQPIRRTYTAVVKRYHSKSNGGGLREEVTYQVDGYDWEACVEVKTPGGVVVGKAEAMCSRSEATWSQRDEYAVRSMAETRAESRAFRRAIGWIVHMAGYSPTPAEEMGHEPGRSMEAAPPWGPPIGAAARGAVFALLKICLDGDADAAKDVGAALAARFGYLPEAAARAIEAIAEARRVVGPAEPEPESAAEAVPEAETAPAADEADPEVVDGAPVPETDADNEALNKL